MAVSAPGLIAAACLLFALLLILAAPWTERRAGHDSATGVLVVVTFSMLASLAAGANAETGSVAGSRQPPAHCFSGPSASTSLIFGAERIFRKFGRARTREPAGGILP